MHTDQIFSYTLLKYCFLYSAKQDVQHLCHLTCKDAGSEVHGIFWIHTADPLALSLGNASWENSAKYLTVSKNVLSKKQSYKQSFKLHT